MKYLAVIEFKDGELITITFGSNEEMKDYIEVECAEYIERVILTMKFSTEKNSSDIKILSHN